MMLLTRHRLVVALFAAVAVIVVAASCGPTVSGAQDVSLNALEQEVAERMANSVLVGRFVVAGSEDAMPRPERYEIEGVTKVGEDQWRFDARIQYGDTNVTLPVCRDDALGGRHPDGLVDRSDGPDAGKLHGPRHLLP